ncbi:hypothetical protein Aph02nite_16770 [Actinoplanes philippinensis]|uniref:hypothetical protein n=1 Tax=Actinoplanes philippinensis TaxID=35752 RepID=UPI001945A141|nr:hypothetical protein [Actinoplanes philippinensis]GIE75727.1 hypothetical protein Aph02nite_16770 [Actinoplanes philippinensis]
MRLLPVITGALVAGSVLAPTAARAAIHFDPAGRPGSVPAGHVRLGPVTGFVGAEDMRFDPAPNTGFDDAEDIRFDPAPNTGFDDAEDIRFDPATNTGFVGAEDVRKAFGWDEAGLIRNAPEVGFTYHVGKEAIYAVTCEKGVRVEAGHNPGSTSAGLDAEVAWENPGRTLTGFRITGASSGASSMDVPPEPGLPCPDDKGGEIRSARYLNTTVTTGLSAEFRDVQVYFPQHRTVTTAPPEP